MTQLTREFGAYVIGTGGAADRHKALGFGASEFVGLVKIRGGGTLVTIAGPPEARPANGQAIDFVALPDRAQLGEIVRPGVRRTAAHEHWQRRDPRRCCHGLQTERISGQTIIRIRP
ncbi:hypothetical protein [Streptomyces sp. NRRL S-1448]|uniref:hypothetical protein n=1 Tax=Streptomyces sp. NRRL S-1448 TaxID=1463883 RepID=UPI0018FEB9C5|nr:hypothetical protein [Streptomyces sp. NRRL S-1448]